MKNFFLKKRWLIISISVVIVVISLATGFIIAKNKKNNPKTETVDDQKPAINLVLLGPEELTLYLDEVYIEEGIIVLIDGIETDDSYETIGTVDTSIVGEQTLTYKYQNKEITRKIIILDNIPPTITLTGAKTIVITEGSTYKELGFKASDNLDGDITNKVKIEGEVKTKIGTYTLTYKVKDSSNNETSITRTIKVNKKLTVKQEPKEEKNKSEVKPTTFKNEVIDMVYTNKGFKITGTYDNSVDSVYLINTANQEKKSYAVNTVDTNYSGNIDLSTLDNGTYEMYLVSSEGEEKIKNNLPNLLRIKRVKLGDKLITFNYPNNTLQIIIAKHAYKYDVFIDVGHGGPQPGAVNATHLEKHINLTVSLYEKQRYEEHGLRVLLNRTSDTIGLGEGDSDWLELSRRSYAMGLYGTISKIVYSNHHNSFGTTGRMGPEIIVPASYTSAELTPELKIMNAWIDLTPLTENHVRFYTRDYDTGTIHSKMNGETFNIKNYYAVIRIPFNLFNVKSITFEPAYMSNATNWNWYWNEENWKKLSEAKIKIYVESLGEPYKAPGEVVPIP